MTTLFATRWPSYKLSWLNTVYAAIPSVRSLPLSWTQEGLQPNQTGGFLAVCSAMTAAMALTPWSATAAPAEASRVWRWAAAFLTAAGAVVVFMSGSRAALAGLAAAVLLVLIVRTRRRLWAWGAGIAVAALGLYASGP